MYRTLIGFLLSVFVAIAAWGEFLSNVRNTAAIQAVAEGQRADANAAWWGFDAEDATECLQAAIDSKARRVVVPYVGAEWVIRPIRLRGDLELVFEPGVVVVAKRGEFRGKGDSLFTARNAQNLAIRGYGATLRMWKRDYQSNEYEKAEWRMGIDVIGCTRVRIEGLRIESTGGDGVYIGANDVQPYSEDVAIRDVVCHDNHRQGISVISAVNLLIENCLLSGTSGTEPEAGIDFEPNLPTERLDNCIVRNCVMADNAGAGILVYLKPMSRETKPISVLFENCHVRGGKDTGIGVGAIKDDGPQGRIEFRNCTVENAAGGGVYVYDKSPSSAGVRFTNCKWANVAMADSGRKSRHPPLLLHLRRPEIASKIGGIEFDSCYVYDSLDRPALVVEHAKEEGAIEGLDGVIYVRNPHGTHMETGSRPVRSSLIMSVLNEK